MAAHRYWRVYVTRTNVDGSGSDWWCEELSFRSAADADLSVGGTAIGSTPYDGTYTAAQAFDKSTATNGFASLTLPAWLGYDHGTPVDVASVLMTVPTSGAPIDEQPMSNAAKLQWSDDGVSWFDEGTHLLSDTPVYTLGAVARLTPYNAGPANRIAFMIDAVRVMSPTPPQSPVSKVVDHVGAAYTLQFKDVVDGGKFKAVVYTDVNALPADQPVAPRHVRLHDFDGQGRLVRSGWSEMVGGQAVCVFENIRQGNYYAVGFDHTGAYDAEVAANLPLEPM